MKNILALFSFLISTHLLAAEDSSKLRAPLLQLYEHLHSHPELSLKENETAKLLASELRKLGLKVQERFGGTGVVAVYSNGEGPNILIRADSDALPIAEETGLAYASHRHQLDSSGMDVPVMHACGHDVHMTVLMGTVEKLLQQKDQWHGTLIVVLQSAEEKGMGALQLLDAGLYQKFPRPHYNIALHVAADLPAGQVGYTSGYAMANVDSVDITVYGEGGHGAAPQKTKDPIVLASQLVLALQTIVSREIPPTEPAVVTVGSIHGGSQHNIIGNEVKLQLTLRSYSLEVRQQILAAIKRISRGLALAAGLPEQKMPLIEVQKNFTPSVYNDPALTQRASKVFSSLLGEQSVKALPPVMVGEDFGQYGLVEPRIPSLIFWLGSIGEKRYQEAQKQRKQLPTLHSSSYYPDAAKTLATGISSMTALAIELFQKPKD